jgi:hypothetical protein
MPLKFRTELLLALLLLLPGTFIFAQPSAEQSGPVQVRPGFGTCLQLMVYRNGITGPVRFIQDLPAGWSADKLPVFNAELRVTDNKMRITWLNFPLKDTVTIAYEIKVPEKAAIGQVISLSGRLEYFEQGKIKQVAVKPQTIKTVKFYSRLQ